ncbi:hypothetical protein Trydic_g8672 [Trypoxylus dichotomus]
MDRSWCCIFSSRETHCQYRSAKNGQISSSPGIYQFPQDIIPDTGLSLDLIYTMPVYLGATVGAFTSRLLSSLTKGDYLSQYANPTTYQDA